MTTDTVGHTNWCILWTNHSWIRRSEKCDCYTSMAWTPTSRVVSKVETATLPPTTNCFEASARTFRCWPEQKTKQGSTKKQTTEVQTGPFQNSANGVKRNKRPWPCFTFVNKKETWAKTAQTQLECTDVAVYAQAKDRQGGVSDLSQWHLRAVVGLRQGGTVVRRSAWPIVPF